MRPRPIAVTEVLEDIPGLMDLAALHQRRLAEDGADRFPQRLRAVEDHEQTPVSPEAAALQIREQVLTDARVLRRAIPEAERVLLAVGRDPKRHDQAVLADMHAVDDQADHVERVERGGLPRGQLGRRLRHEATTHRALARAPASHRRRHGFETPGIPPRGDAHEHLLDDAAIQRVDIGHRLERGQRHLAAVGAHTGAPDRHFAATQHHLAAHGAGSRGVALGDVCVPRTAEGRAILFEHGFQHLQPGSNRTLEQLGARIDQQIDEREVTGRFNRGGPSDCARLLHGGSLLAGFSPWLVTGRIARTSEEPPLLKFQQLLGHPLLMYGSLIDQDINCRAIGRCTYGDVIDRELLDMVPRVGADEARCRNASLARAFRWTRISAARSSTRDTTSISATKA